jgi:hypothetical protein
MCMLVKCLDLSVILMGLECEKHRVLMYRITVKSNIRKLAIC